MGADDLAAGRFRFGPLERRGVVAGWRGGQLAVIAVALVVAVLVLRADQSLPGIATAVAVVGLAAFLTTWPLGGRTAEEWAPDAVRHATAMLARGARQRSARHRGAPFAGLEIIEVDLGEGRQLGLVVDATRQRYTAAVRARGAGFVLLGADDQQARVASWSALLASLARAGAHVHRLQWLARSVPDDGTAVRRHLETSAVRGADDPARRSYEALVAEQVGVTQSHEVLVSVTVDARRAARSVRAAGGGTTGACTVAAREVASLRRQLGDAGIGTDGPLDAVALARAIAAAHRRGPSPSASTAWPWPMGIEAAWGHVRTDDTVHAVYWVAEWPRTDVGPDFLAPLLVADVRRTVSLVMEPVGAVEAARRVEQARTADIADAELRRRGGFLATARRRREEDVLARREAELADGHAQYRFTGYVTVTAADVEVLEDACVRTEQAAGRCGLELRRCYGDQAAALATAMPLGRGLA